MPRLTGIALSLLLPLSVQAGDQRYEPLAASTRTVMQKAISDQAIPAREFIAKTENKQWLSAMSDQLKTIISDPQERNDFLSTVHYEATRAGLDPQLVLSVIQVESGFKKYAVSEAGARGYMQVMPFWIETIGSNEHNLFHLRVNLRYGCTILRHYLDIEKGDYFRALGRYNGSLGQATYPQQVFSAWRDTWTYHAVTESGSVNDLNERSQ